MKSLISYSLLAAMAATGAAFAAEATTTPVGYVTVGDQTSTISVAANTDVALSVPLLRASEFAGTVSSVTGSTLVVEGAQNWTATQFTADPSKPYVLYVTSGTQEGLSALVTASSGSSLTLTVVEGDLAGVAVDSEIKIVPAWTAKTFIAPSAVAPGTQLLAFAGTVPGINLAPSQILTSTGTAWVYTFGGSGSADNFIVYPTESFVLRAGATAVNSLVVTGEVPTFKHRQTLSKLTPSGQAQDIRFSYTNPASQGLLASGLGITAGDQLLIFNNAVAGKNKAPSQIITYTGTSWVGTFGISGSQNDYQLTGGQGYVYRTASGATASNRDWISAQSYLPSL